MTATRASAPGKVLWVGEYAVLDGAPGVVAAVARRAVAHVSASLPTLSPFLAAVHEEITRALGDDAPAAAAARRILVDSSDLQHGGVKLGIGSSAAATVAAVAAALGSADPAHVHPLAHRAHAAAQAPRGARGSGADIAASVYGGILVVQRPPGADDLTPLTVRPLVLPEGVTPVLVWTGVAADTPALVARVRAFASQDPTGHAAARAELAAAAASLIAACDVSPASAAARAVVAAIDQGEDALAHLGALAGADLVPPALAPLAALARRHQGAAKPTGAGGGDQILAVFATADDAAAFRDAARAAGNTVLDAPVDPQGVRLEPALDQTPPTE